MINYLVTPAFTKTLTSVEEVRAHAENGRDFRILKVRPGYQHVGGPYMSVRNGDDMLVLYGKRLEHQLIIEGQSK
jgi:hypothetical protein